MKQVRFLATTALATVLALPAAAATIDIDSVSGVWSSVTPGGVVNISGVGGNAITWGTPASGSPGPSGYTFTGNAPQSDISSPFVAGTFTHDNNPILANPTPSSITGATLDVTVSGSVDLTPFTLISQFVFAHNETTNNADPCADGGANGVGVNSNGCADIVTLVSASFGSDSIIVDGEEYVFNITGFSSGISFESAEEGSNSTDLLGEFVTRTSVVPLPAAGWMLIAGVGGLAALRRRKKAS